MHLSSSGSDGLLLIIFSLFDLPVPDSPLYLPCPLSHYPGSSLRGSNLLWVSCQPDLLSAVTTVTTLKLDIIDEREIDNIFVVP